ncbi:MAG TPA: hypothetical protein VKA73_07940 [Rubrobacter sp.]|nr:hypothetical protein [Rubrobacter sp.]
MFRSADLVLVNKVDLLPHLHFDLEVFLRNLDAVNPGVERILTSAATGEGVDEWCSWLTGRAGCPRDSLGGLPSRYGPPVGVSSVTAGKGRG